MRIGAFVLIATGILLCAPAGWLAWRSITFHRPESLSQLVAGSPESRRRDLAGISFGKVSLTRRHVFIIFCGLAVLGISLLVVGMDLLLKEGPELR
jgi:hypothetical protein